MYSCLSLVSVTTILLDITLGIVTIAKLARTTQGTLIRSRGGIVVKRPFYVTVDADEGCPLFHDNLKMAATLTLLTRHR